MVYVVVALILLIISTPFLIRLLRQEPTFVPLHTLEGKQRVIHHLGSVQEDDRTFDCYVIEKQ